MTGEIKIPINLNGKDMLHTIYIGDGKDPFGFQIEYIKNSGAVISEDFLKAIERLKKIATENGMNMSEIAEYLSKNSEKEKILNENGSYSEDSVKKLLDSIEAEYKK